ncbi:MazG-like family protein [Streptococcus salivarius]|uniref:MazG-like family protein n=1 Tax=Streptococcus salivarius TaxID=1304 RepID=UPI0019D66AAB|nr:MazG-like family protein [Streptococcus salivarius]
MPYNHGIFIDTVKLSRRWLLGSISRLEEPTYDGIPALIDKINEWADSRGLKQADSKIQWMRITEEVGEIRDVLLKPTKFTEPQAALKDAIGDTLVTIIVLAHQLDLDVTECLSIAYEEIKNRKGKMVNGTFVKKEDL